MRGFFIGWVRDVIFFEWLHDSFSRDRLRDSFSSRDGLHDSFSRDGVRCGDKHRVGEEWMRGEGARKVLQLTRRAEPHSLNRLVNRRVLLQLPQTLVRLL